MTKRFVRVPADWRPEDVEGWMQSIPDLGFQYMGTVRRLPGGHHWHLRGAVGSGIVDCTFDPAGAVILAVHDNRRGEWADEAVPILAASLEHRVHLV